MKRILLRTALLVSSVFCSLTSYSQNLQVSGGGRFGTAICGDGTVKSWGANNLGQLGRAGGGDGIKDVLITDGGQQVKISAIDGGSGGHTLALDCDGHVWAWGLNCGGQLGNGQGGRTEAVEKGDRDQGDCNLKSQTPVKVLAGEQNPANPTGDFLKDIVYISGGNRASYAIDKDGALWAWGSNVIIYYDDSGPAHAKIGGLLGNNDPTMPFSNTPVRVRLPNGQPLANVVQVDATDNACYALTADGTVYSFGSNQNAQLGNGVNWNTANNDAATNYRYAATPVLAANSIAGNAVSIGNLTGIKQITAGDTHGLFIDGSGNVWGVGANYANMSSGTNKPNWPGGADGRGDNLYAIKVASGNSTTITGDATYLTNVSNVSASQIGSAAVVSITSGTTTKGYLYTWGANFSYGEGGEGGNVFGQMGNGKCDATGNNTAPTLVTTFKRANGTTVNYTDLNVIGVSDGDGVFYVITQDPTTLQSTLWAMGGNNKGQAGIAASDPCVSVPTEVDLGCDLSDPCPEAKFGVDTLYRCPGYKETLVAGTIADSYEYTWVYTDLKNAKTTTIKKAATDPKANQLEITGFGKYKVSIIKKTLTCDKCLPTADSVYILPVPTPVDTLIRSFCGKEAVFAFRDLYQPKFKGGFAVYKDSIGGSPIGGKFLPTTAAWKDTIRYQIDTTSTNRYKIDTVNYYTVWLDDTTKIPARIVPALPCVPDVNSSATMDQFYSELTVFNSVRLDSVSVQMRTYNNPATVHFEISIYESKKDNNGKDIPDLTKRVYSNTTQNYTVTNTTFQGFNIPTGMKLPLAGSVSGKIYYLNIKKIKVGNDDAAVSPLDCNNGYPYKDNLDQNTVHLTSYNTDGTNPQDPTSSNTKLKVFYNYSFSRPTDYTCGRIKLTAYKKCPPCNRPKSVSVVSTVNPITACDSSATPIALKGKYEDGGVTTGVGAAPDSGMYYVWYKKGKAFTSADYTLFSSATYTANTFDKTLSSPIVLASADSGTWVLRVQHGNKNLKLATCFREDSIKVKIITKPKKLKPIDTTFCQGAPNAKFEIKPTTKEDTIKWFNFTTMNPVAAPTSILTAGFGQIRYKVRQSSFGCLGDTSTVRATIQPKPNKTTFTGDTLLCLGEALNVTAKPAANYTLRKFFWTFPSTSTVDTSGLTPNDVISKAAVALTDAGDYSVIAESNKGCRDTTKLTISVTSTPKAKLTLVEEKFCDNGKDRASIKITVDPPTVSKYTVVLGRSVEGDTTFTLRANDTTIYTRKGQEFSIKSLKDAAGCDAAAADINSKVTTVAVAKPMAKILNPTGTQEMISEEFLNDIRATDGPAGYTGTWSKITASQQGALTPVNDSTVNLTGLTKTEEDGAGLGTTDLGWTVKDLSGQCPDTMAKISIIRRDVTIPKAGNDTSVCEGFTTFIRKGNGQAATSVETYDWLFTAGTATKVDNNTLSIPGNLAPGTYTYVFNIKNSVASTDLKDTFLLHVIAKPIAQITDPEPVRSPAAGGIPDSSSITFNQAQLDLVANDPGNGYEGTWTYTAPGTLTGPTTSPTNKLAGLNFDEQSVLKWTVQDTAGKCPAETATLLAIRKNITVPDVDDDTLCFAGDDYVLKGNGLIPNEVPKWTFVDANPPIGTPTITVSASDPREATVSGISLPTNVGKVVLRFEYSIQSPLGATTPDTMTLILWEKTQVANAGRDTSTCSDKQLLQGNGPDQPTATGEWIIFKGQGNLQSTGVKGQTLLTDLNNELETSELKWVITNGVCGSSADTVAVTQAGKITPPKITVGGGVAYPVGKEAVIEIPRKVDTLCVGSTFTITGNDYVTTPPRNEKGEWKYISGPITIPGALTDKVQTITPTANQQDTESVWEWTISTDVPGCLPASVTVTLVPRDVPPQPLILGSSPVCEGTDTLYKVSPGGAGFLPVTYTWSDGTLGASRTGAAVGESTTYLIKSDQAASIDKGEFFVTPSNRCGDGEPGTKEVLMDFAPRAFVENDTLHGYNALCATSNGVKFYLDRLEPGVTEYVWTYNGLGSLQTYKDTAYVTGWPTNQSSTDNTITLELRNKCSDKAIASGIARVIKDTTFVTVAPEPVKVTLTSDKAFNKFCIPQDRVVFTATPVTQLPNLIATYTFYVNTPGNLEVSTGVSPYQATYDTNTIQNGDVVYVRLEAGPNQCITTNKDSASVTMDGYVFPDSLVTPSMLFACESDEVITLTVPNDGRNSSGIEWYRDDIHLPQFSGMYSITLTDPSQSGGYQAEVNRNVCAGISFADTLTYIRIFQKPDFHFAVDPLVVEYREGIAVPIPVVYTKPNNNVDEIIKAQYRDRLWLATPDSTHTLFVPQREEKDIIYTLSAATGDSLENKWCWVSKDIRVINSLPVIIPNAFSPNGDGLNETWVITGLAKYPNTSVKVYNRWGSSMFVNNDGYRASWDGKHNGVDLPAGTYYYVVELKGSIDNTDRAETGSITIVR